jgi:hypothetical protein
LIRESRWARGATATATTSDYAGTEDYNYVSNEEVKRRFATSAPAIVSKTATQLLTQVDPCSVEVLR